MEKEEEVAMTERDFFCLGESGFTLPLCHETAVYSKQKWYLVKKTYNLLMHQRAEAGSRAFFEGAGANKKNYREPEPRTGSR